MWGAVVLGGRDRRRLALESCVVKRRAMRLSVVARSGARGRGDGCDIVKGNVGRLVEVEYEQTIWLVVAASYAYAHMHALDLGTL